MKSKREKRRRRALAQKERFRRKYEKGGGGREVSDFVREQRRPPVHERVLRAALRSSYPLKTSHWMKGGVQRATHATGLSAFDVIDVLEAFVRWAYANELVPQLDSAVQVAQLELLRRQNGAEPRAVSFAEPLANEDFRPDEVVEAVAQWEALSYAMFIREPQEDQTIFERLFAVTLTLARHLAATSGLPIQLHRLEPSRFAAELDSHRTRDVGHPWPVPEHFEEVVLVGTAMVLERLAARGFIDPSIADELILELDALALPYTSDPRYAA